VNAGVGQSLHVSFAKDVGITIPYHSLAEARRVGEPIDHISGGNPATVPEHPVQLTSARRAVGRLNRVLRHPAVVPGRRGTHGRPHVVAVVVVRSDGEVGDGDCWNLRVVRFGRTHINPMRCAYAVMFDRQVGPLARSLPESKCD